MKKLVYIFVFPLMLAASSVLSAQNYADESLGLPGDNLNLYAVMKLFQESETLEGFERNLNDERSRINNLDLNGDNYIDYIRVIDQPDRDVHLIVLQVAINARENQDVAVFVVQREANNRVRIQLIGDEALYGRNYIIEPNYDDVLAGETPNPGYNGRTTVVVNRVTTYEVAAWPLIRFMFLPTYIVWHSPWYWDYYPNWWSPWRPYYWHYYYGYHSHWYPHYHSYYRHSDHYYYPRYESYYYGSRRSHSNYVAGNITSGRYKATYSHPESRRAGSELYTKTYGNGNNRTATRSTGNQQVTRRTSVSENPNNTTRRTTTTRSSEINTGRTKSGSGVSNAPVRRSTEATTGRTATSTGNTKSTVKTETRKPATDSRVNSAPARRASEASPSRPSTQRETSKSAVKTDSRRSSSGTKVSNSSSSRRSSGSSDAKSNSSGSYGPKKSGEKSSTTNSRRR